MPSIWCALTKRPCHPLITETLDKDEAEKMKWLKSVRIVKKDGVVIGPIDYQGYTTIHLENNYLRLIDASTSYEEEHDCLLVIEKVYQMLLEHPDFNTTRNLYDLLKNYQWRSEFCLLDDFCQEVGYCDVVVCPERERERYAFQNVITLETECYFELTDPEQSIDNSEELVLTVEDFVIFSNRV